MKKLIALLQSKIFFLKYHLGLLEEGKDFITCGLHDECLECMIHGNQDNCEVKKQNEKHRDRNKRAISAL